MTRNQKMIYESLLVSDKRYNKREAEEYLNKILNNTEEKKDNSRNKILEHNRKSINPSSQKNKFHKKETAKNYMKNFYEEDDTPKDVKQAVIAIWISMVLVIIYSILFKYINYSDDKYFGDLINAGHNFSIFSTILIIGIYSLVPYFLYKGSNLARYLFTVFSILGFFVYFIMDTYTKLTLVFDIIQLSLNLYILYKLFTPKSNYWFKKVV